MHGPDRRVSDRAAQTASLRYRRRDDLSLSLRPYPWIQAKVRATAPLKAGRDVALVRGSCLSAKCHIPIPFPRRSVVGPERLAPNWTIRIRFVPLKHDDDRFPFKNVFCVKSSDVAIEGTDLRNVHYDRVAIRPINTPKSGLRIEQAK